jgi:hypothetical protein
MRDEAGVLIGLFYLVSNFTLKRMDSFPDWRPALLFPQTKQYIVTADFNGTKRISCFLGLLGREHMVWKHGNRTAKLAPQTPANRNFFKMISP